MANELQLKRRISGSAGAPPALKSGEPSVNMVDEIVYIGFGDDGAGAATSIVAIAGPGAYVDKVSGQTISGIKVFSVPPTVPSPVGPNDAVNKAYADSLAGTGFTAGSGIDAAQLTSMVIQADATIARLADPIFSGTPTAPTATTGTNTTQLATTAFVAAAVADLIGSAPGALDTLEEFATALQNNPDQITDILTAQAGKLTASSNLSDVVDAVVARGNLGLGSMAVQDAGAVAITGGTIDNVVIDGGTF